MLTLSFIQSINIVHKVGRNKYFLRQNRIFSAKRPVLQEMLKKVFHIVGMWQQRKAWISTKKISGKGINKNKNSCFSPGLLDLNDK